MDVEGEMDFLFCPPEIKNELLSFGGVKDKVVLLTQVRQMFHLEPVGCLLIVCNKNDYCGVVCKFYYGVGGVDGGAVAVNSNSKAFIVIVQNTTRFIVAAPASALKT